MHELDCNKRWEIIEKVLSEMNYDGIDRYEYDESDEDNHLFLIVQSWSNIKDFNEIFKKIYPEYNIELKEEDSASIIDELTHYNWGFSDEYTQCENCNKVIYYNEWGTVNYAITGDEMICLDCLHHDIGFQKSYCKNMENNPEKAISNLTDDELTGLGYEKLNGYYEYGWYGKMDNPENILKELLEKEPNGRFIFVITNMAQFETRFEVWRKNKV